MKKNAFLFIALLIASNLLFAVESDSQLDAGQKIECSVRHRKIENAVLLTEKKFTLAIPDNPAYESIYTGKTKFKGYEFKAECTSAGCQLGIQDIKKSSITSAAGNFSELLNQGVQLSLYFAKEKTHFVFQCEKI
jgi:hypothetical protein